MFWLCYKNVCDYRKFFNKHEFAFSIAAMQIWEHEAEAFERWVSINCIGSIYKIKLKFLKFCIELELMDMKEQEDLLRRKFDKEKDVLERYWGNESITITTFL